MVCIIISVPGQPSSVTAPGDVITSFGYDAFGRQTSIADPSAGTQSFSDSYAADGTLTRKVTDANGKAVTSNYDQYGRVTNVARPEFSTTYAYTADGLLTAETSTNGTSNTFSYDTYDRPLSEKENVPDNKYLQKDYTYSGGNVAAVKYSSQSGAIGTEQFAYAYGHNTEIKLNGTTSIWKLTEENALGQPTKAATGPMNRTYSYTAYGMPTGRTAGTVQSFTYDFDVAKGNLKSRKDNTRNLTETFGYDNLNRLTNAAGKAITYSANGNITSMGGVGTMDYGNTAKPYQVTMLTPTGDAVPEREQTVTYTSFQRPSSITENGITAAFLYNAAGDRARMQVTQNGNPLLTRYYIGGQYELDAQTNTERLYLGGDAYSAPAVYVKEANVWKIYYICRDYLGSITHIANADGSLKQELSYDAWGRLRDPATQAAYAPGSEPALFLGRGYTGHEHLVWFGLVNMNARLYDSALGRFLSPDPYVQAPGFTQNYNRYIYAMNNPLVYIDEDGEIAWFIPIIIGAALFGTGNMAAHIIKGDINNLGDALSYFAQGAVAGAIVGATWSFGLASLSGTSLLGGGSAIQGMGFATHGFLQKVGWTIMGAKTISTLSTVASVVSHPENAGEILLGRTYTNNFGQALSRYTWEGIQTWLGYNVSQIRNTIGDVDRVDYFGGATFSTGENQHSRWGVSIGHNINIDITDEIQGNFQDRVISDPLFMHEYGHTFDSQIFGLSYLFVIGMPSIFSAANATQVQGEPAGVKTHDFRWYERRANKHAAKYFKKYGVNWSNYETEYPRKDRR